jgi:formylglycine-generating enzyme required for sulfatase activity
MAEVRAYRANVDGRMARLLAAQPANGELHALLELGLQHEQQHQELMLTDVKHLLAQSALLPAYLDAAAPVRAGRTAGWINFDGGLERIGHEGDGFCFDNELPRHPEYMAPFALASRLVTNGEYLAFIEAGGYRDASLWLAEGWDWVNAAAPVAPPVLARDAHGQWWEFTLHGAQARPGASGHPSVAV